MGPFYKCGEGKNNKYLAGPKIICSFMGNRVPVGVSSGTDDINKPSSPNGQAVSEFQTNGYRVYLTNAATYAITDPVIITRHYYTFGRKYAKLYVRTYNHQAGNGNSGHAGLTFYGYHTKTGVSDTLTALAGTLQSGSWLIYDVSNYDEVYFRIYASANDRFQTGTAGMGELVIEFLRMENEETSI